MLDATTSDLVPFFSKEGPNHIVQDWPRSDPDGLVRFWPNTSGPVASQCARNIVPGSGRMQPARYQFPTFRLSCVSSIDGWILSCRTCPGSDFVLADCVRFWAKQIRSRSKPVCKDHQACSGQCFQCRCESDPACLLEEDNPRVIV